MTEYLAHSAKRDCPAQKYSAHIKGVCDRALRYAEEAERYSPNNKGILRSIVQNSALLHDLGKLDKQNQKVLSDTGNVRSKLPINHVDAGCAALKLMKKPFSALTVYSHHRGLPNMAAEKVRGTAIFRDESQSTRDKTDESLLLLLDIHNEIVPTYNFVQEEKPKSGRSRNVFCRMALSCLVDADHSDTAFAYNQAPATEHLPKLCASRRLEALDKYVATLGGQDVRSTLRREMYYSCRNANVFGSFASCDSPVGSGKTTAVMAHLLQQAIERGLRRIIVVLPYTSIIQQSVDVYRKALVLPGENAEEVVAELHSRADFEDPETRYLTSLWRSPIIVTTAVAFFETLASNRPSTLRRLHELPGSVIFVDEAHNAMPIRLFPLAWRWMNVFAEEWGCYWVLASGSLVRYWQLGCLNSLMSPSSEVTELVDSDLRKRLMKYEGDRVVFLWKPKALSRKKLIELVQNKPGPRLLILNTIQNAAIVAQDLCVEFGRECVEHLSTALTPEDRNTVIERVKLRLKNEKDTNWTLVATSCVEAGVDFSFRTGFRELSSLLSLLQAAGRVNRHGRFSNAEMWSFSLEDNTMLTKNPALDESREVLKRYFTKNIRINPELSTRSMNDEITLNDICIGDMKKRLKEEEAMAFETVNEKFNVIDSDTVSVIIDETLAKAVAYGQGDWRTLQKKSVSIRRSKVKEWNLRECAAGIYQWTLRYDDFLGYMSGVLDLIKTKTEVLFY
ncbi:MAG: CRISPR-associated endonuclease Cas3'' [Christensenellaceae bacterium]|nr:CRISPR-associated endonuclease Cas3'' [Christensenellaceae bacterium]